jgi:hypothetical protein
VIVEDKATEVAWAILTRYTALEDFERILRTQQEPSWNRAVAMIADAMREYAEWCGKGNADNPQG